MGPRGNTHDEPRQEGARWFYAAAKNSSGSPPPRHPRRSLRAADNDHPIPLNDVSIVKAPNRGALQPIALAPVLRGEGGVRGLRYWFGGYAMINAFRHISLRVPQPGRTGEVSFEVSYSQVTWTRVEGVSLGRSWKK